MSVAGALSHSHPHPALSFGRVSGRTVFIDLDSDLYFTAAADEERQLIQSAICARPRAAKASILEQAPAPVTMRDTFAVFIDLIHVRKALRTGRIADIVASVAGD